MSNIDMNGCVEDQMNSNKYFEAKNAYEFACANCIGESTCQGCAVRQAFLFNAKLFEKRGLPEAELEFIRKERELA